VPTVLRYRGLRVVIHLPMREHGPAHVHVFTADGEVVINLAGAREHAIREVKGMRDVDIARSMALVEDNLDYLMTRWRELHG
jgi:hypothetical protein